MPGSAPRSLRPAEIDLLTKAHPGLFRLASTITIPTRLQTWTSECAEVLAQGTVQYFRRTPDGARKTKEDPGSNLAGKAQGRRVLPRRGWVRSRKGQPEAGSVTAIGWNV